MRVCLRLEWVEYIMQDRKMGNDRKIVQKHLGAKSASSSKCRRVRIEIRVWLSTCYICHQAFARTTNP